VWKSCNFSAVLVFLITAAALPVAAQTFYSTILGTITDPSDAVVPDATVTLLNPSTEDRRAVKTDAYGSYRFISLIPAVYRHFHLTDSRVSTVLTACLVAAVTASQLSDRLRRAVLDADQPIELGPVQCD
jgi:hypothetical protein